MELQTGIAPWQAREAVVPRGRLIGSNWHAHAESAAYTAYRHTKDPSREPGGDGELGRAVGGKIPGAQRHLPRRTWRTCRREPCLPVCTGDVSALGDGATPGAAVLGVAAPRGHTWRA